MSGVQLRGYQREAVEAVEGAWDRGLRRPLVALPTGSGKTIVFAELIRRRGGRSLVLAHREELLHQAAGKIRLVVPGARIGLVRAESDDHEAPIVVASVQTLARPERLSRVARDFGLVTVDEAHHATAETYRRLLESFGQALAVGVTATPERADGGRLADVWEEIVFRRTLPEMIRAGYLCDLRAIRVQLAVDLDQVAVRGGDYAESEAEDAYRAANAPQHAVAAYLDHAAGRKALAFTPGVALAHEMAEAFQSAGVEAEALDGETPRELRAELLAAFSAGHLRVLVNCGVLTEGYNEPTVDCLILARPTRSRPLYAQMIGRGTRKLPGKADCLVIDLVGASERHDLVTLGSLFGVELGDRESALEAVEALEAERARAEADVPSGVLVARSVELFDARSLHWATGNGLYVLPAGEAGIVAIVPGEAGWRVWHLARGEECLVAEGLDLEYAQGTAEDLVRRLGGGGLARRAAAWRNSPATPSQLDTLRRWGIATRAGMSRGEASDALSLAGATSALAPATSRQVYALRRRGVRVPRGLTKRQASRLLNTNSPRGWSAA